MRLTGLAAFLLAVVVACSSGSESPTETGIVLSVDSPALGRVDSFELLTSDGRTLTFVTSELEFQAEFPVSHLSEHQLLGDPVEVTYQEDGERLIVERLADGSG